MPVSVPTQEEFLALSTRVDKLEAGSGPTPGKESPDGTIVDTVGPAIQDAAGNLFTITVDKRVGINGLADTKTANVVKLYYKHPTMTHQNTAGNWYAAAMTGTTATYTQVSDPTQTPPPIPAGVISVSLANGFRASGTRMNLRGYNCNWDQYNNVKGALFSKFPGSTLVRVVCNNDTTVANIQPMINELTGKHMVCIIDYHTGVGSQTIGWYQTMCAAFKSNPLCFMQTPNEPKGSVANDQIAIINAIRAAGWPNPIGIELTEGYKFDNVKPVTDAVPQNNQLYLSPHNYGDWWNGNMQNTANATGLYSIVSEFGDSTDGSNVDPNGADCVKHIIQSQMARECEAAFWSATNNYHEGDNLFLDPHGNTLSSMGKLITDMKWLA